VPSSVTLVMGDLHARFERHRGRNRTDPCGYLPSAVLISLRSPDHSVWKVPAASTRL
jgi:hypothetical protein